MHLGEGGLVEKMEVKLTPINRLSMSFDLEMGLDKHGLFNSETYNKFVEMYHISEMRRDRILRSVLILDALAFLILSGGSIEIPGVGLELAKIPAILEIVIFTSSISFFFFCVAFVNTQCYSGIVDQIGIRLSQHQNIDPDFINASKKHFDFFLKVFRPKLNIWGEDFYESRNPFTFFSAALYGTVFIVLMVLPFTHLWVLLEALLVILSFEWSLYFELIFLVAVVLINVTGVVMVAALSKAFTFNAAKPQPQAQPTQTPENVVAEN